MIILVTRKCVNKVLIGQIYIKRPSCFAIFNTEITINKVTYLKSKKVYKIVPQNLILNTFKTPCSSSEVTNDNDMKKTCIIMYE